MDESAAARLRKARLTLQAVQDKKGIRPFEVKELVDDAPGIYRIGDSAADVIFAIAKVFVEPVWVAVVEVPDIGWEAASQAGWDLGRTVIVKTPEDQAGAIISTLLEGIDVLVVGPVQLSHTIQRTLAAKARQLHRRIYATQTWSAVGGRRVG